MSSVQRPDLYRGQLNVWVEDIQTRDYLAALWPGNTILFLIAGGSQGVLGAVHDAEKSNFKNVFGIVDRDFGHSNQDRWQNTNVHVFTASRHEIENYWLVPEALAAAPFNALRLTSSQLEQEIIGKANEQIWWHACCRTIALIQSQLNEDFPKHPKIPHISAHEQAQQYLAADQWLLSLPARATEFTIDWLEMRLQQFGNEAQESVDSSLWKGLFAGKEILKHICSRIAHNQPTNTADVAKFVGAWQRQNNQVPADLELLRQTLHQRIA